MEKKERREIHDILRMQGFNWLANGKDSCWIKCRTRCLIFPSGTSSVKKFWNYSSCSLIINSQPVQKMVELGLIDYFQIAGTSALIGTLLVGFYFSRKQMQGLSMDIETEVLSDLDKKLQGLVQMTVDRPELVEVVDNASRQSPKLSFAMYVLYVCSHAFHMHQRKVLMDNEWEGWLRWIRAAFEEGTIIQYWKSGIRPEKWFDPAFQDFIDNEIIGQGKMARGEHRNADSRQNH
jgi:hypothetical protein